MHLSQRHPTTTISAQIKFLDILILILHDIDIIININIIIMGGDIKIRISDNINVTTMK